MEINQDGYTMEVTGPEGVRVLVATKAKPNQDAKSPLEREFYKSFLDVSFCICVWFCFSRTEIFLQFAIHISWVLILSLG